MIVRRSIIALFLTALIVPFVFIVSLYASAWYHRWRAEQLMKVVGTFQLGITTQNEYENSLRHLLPYTEKVYRSNEGEKDTVAPDAFGVGNEPEWLYKTYRWLPDTILGLLTYWPVTEGIVFGVEPSFANNRLSAMSLYEWHGNGHPGGGHVEVRAGRVDHWYKEIPESKFNGYEVHQMHTSTALPWSSTVRMDSRATTEQRRRAMDFKFECFTSFQSCDDGRRILDPVVPD